MTATDRRPVVRSQVEPRIVERRRTVHEAQRRGRRRRWIAAGVVVALIAAAAGVLWSPLTDVDTVSVTGVDTLTPDEIRAGSGVSPGDHLVAVDLAAARQQLRRMPMVAAAQVTREWPDTVHLAVTEETPLLRVRAGDTVRVVSTTGRVLPDALPGAEALPELELVDASAADLAWETGADLPAELAPVVLVYARRPDALRDTLSLGRIDDEGSMSFQLGDDASVRFGPVEDVPAKLVAISAFLEQVTLECLDVLDVRQPDRPTASRITGCAVPAPTEVAGTATATGAVDAAGDGSGPAETTATSGGAGG